MFELAPPKLRADAAFAAALCAVDPVGLGGVALRASASPLRAAWLNLLKTLQPAGTPWLRLPHHATDAALLGGLDLAATLHAGRPVAQRGLLARADGGWLLLAMAERCGPNVAAHLSAALDLHEVRLQREGLAHTAPARFGLVALDEGQGDDERLPATLLDRLAFQLVLEPASAADDTPAFTPHDIEQARAALPAVRVPDELVQALCGAALAWGVASLRAPLMALRAVRAAAALAGLEEADESHAALAARLVLAPRATRVPAPPEPQEAEAEEPPPPSEDRTEETQADEDNESSPADPQALEDQLIEAMQSALPPGLLAALQAASSARRKPGPPAPRARCRSTPTGAALLARAGVNRAPGPACMCSTPFAPPHPGSACASAMPRPTRANASRCDAKTFTWCATASTAPPPLCLWSMPPARRHCTAWPRPRARWSCCWQSVGAGRQGGRAGVPRRRGRSAAAAHPLAGQGQTRAGRAARRRWHAAGQRHQRGA
ncbi:hypothetical protein [Hydrogenophaga sp.]|uniref:hypothetical protein n=1 Tax=Hydrogenophaga sp. TaxID=1904254 RepID=UPI003D289CBC